MPTVPTRDSFTQIEGGIGGARLDAPQLRGLPASSGANPTRLPTPNLRVADATTSKFTTPVQEGASVDRATVGARNIQAAGQALEGAAADMGNIFLQMQTQANAVMVDDSVTKANERLIRLQHGDGQDGRPLGFNALKGADAIFRPDDKPLDQEYVEKFDEDLNAIESGLKNDAQKMAFRVQADRMKLSLRNAATQHAAQEFRTYSISTHNGVIKSATESLALNYNNPDISGSVTRDGDTVRGTGEWGRLIGATAQLGFLAGRSEGEIKQDQLTAVSGAHKRIIGAAIQGENIVGAEAWLKAHSAEMTADDVLAVKMVVTKEVDGKLGLAAGRDAVAAVAPTLDPTPMGTLRNVVKKLETGLGSGFKADGSMVEGPQTRYGTAKGPMQVLDGTNKDPGFGVKPAKDDSPEERTRVGNDYLDAMVKRYNGDAGLALAAYNWGPGNVDQARKETAAEGANAWFTKVPKETRKYVTDGLGMLQSGGARPTPPTLSDVLARVDADPRVNQSPNRLQIARAEAMRQWQIVEAGRKDRAESITGDAIVAISNGTPYDALPPALRTAVEQNAPDKIPGLRSFSNTMGKGPEKSDDATYLLLTDPDRLRGMSDAQFLATRQYLSESDWQSFATQRAKAPGDSSASSLNMPAINVALKDRLLAIGVDPSPSYDKEPEAAARVASINKLIRDKMLVAQQRSGKQFTDVEVEAFIDREFTRNVQFRNGTVGPQLTMTDVKQIPKANLDAVRYKLQNAGIKDPTPTQLLNAYWRD